MAEIGDVRGIYERTSQRQLAVTTGCDVTVRAATRRPRAIPASLVHYGRNERSTIPALPKATFTNNVTGTRCRRESCEPVPDATISPHSVFRVDVPCG